MSEHGCIRPAAGIGQRTTESAPAEMATGGLRNGLAAAVVIGGIMLSAIALVSLAPLFSTQIKPAILLAQRGYADDLYRTQPDNPWAFRAPDGAWYDTRSEDQRHADAVRVRLPDHPDTDDYRKYIMAVNYCVMPQSGCMRFDRGDELIILLLERIGRDRAELLGGERNGRRYVLSGEAGEVAAEMTGEGFLKWYGSDTTLYPDVFRPLPRDFGLPDTPSRDDYRRYVARIAASRKGDGENELRLQHVVELLYAVGPAHVDLLLAQLTQLPARTSNERNSWNRHVFTQAVAALACEQNRGPIAAALSRAPELLDVILGHHWERDAAPHIVAMLRRNDPELDPKWFYAGAALQDSTVYPLLDTYLQQRYLPQYAAAGGWGTFITTVTTGGQSDGSILHSALALLPADVRMDMLATVWQGTRNDRRNGEELRLVALRNGMTAALGECIAAWQTAGDTSPVAINGQGIPLPLLVRAFVDIEGDSAAMAAWYQNNRGRIVFNPAIGVRS
ncbi:MAG TPA: hypothetical protein PKM88_07295, partial [bacterium]|nr:hypothetical protein [bacterium]